MCVCVCVCCLPTCRVSTDGQTEAQAMTYGTLTITPCHASPIMTARTGLRSKESAGRARGPDKHFHSVPLHRFPARCKSFASAADPLSPPHSAPLPCQSRGSGRPLTSPRLVHRDSCTATHSTPYTLSPPLPATCTRPAAASFSLTMYPIHSPP